MLSSISPVGEASRGQRWALTASAYLLGSAAAGAATGALAGGAGAAMGLAGSPWPVVAAGAVGLVLDWRGMVPSLHRQVDRGWLTRYRGWVYGGAFGAQLGIGVVTVIPASIVWVMWVTAIATGSLSRGVAIGATFGIMRAAPLLAAGRLHTVSALRRALARMDSSRSRVAQVTVAGQAAVVVTAAGLGIWGTL